VRAIRPAAGLPDFRSLTRAPKEWGVQGDDDGVADVAWVLKREDRAEFPVSVFSVSFFGWFRAHVRI
jgi:hypothetical protein